MKRWKKVCVWVCVVLLCFCAVSCKEEGESDKCGLVTVVLGEREYTVKLNGENNFLALLSENDIPYTVQGTGDFAFLTEVGDLKQDTASGKYLYLYTSAQEDFDVSVYAVEKEYKGKRLVSAGVGVNNLHLYDGVTVLVDYIVW